MKSALAQNGTLGRVSGPRSPRMLVEDNSPRKRPTKSVTFDNMDEIIQYIQPTPEVTQDEWETISLSNCQQDMDFRPLPTLPMSLSEQDIPKLDSTSKFSSSSRNSGNNLFNTKSTIAKATDFNQQLITKSSMKSCRGSLSNTEDMSSSVSHFSSVMKGIEPEIRLNSPISVSDEEFDFNEEESAVAVEETAATGATTDSTHFDRSDGGLVQLPFTVTQPSVDIQKRTIVPTRSGMSPCTDLMDRHQIDRKEILVHKRNKESLTEQDEVVKWRSHHDSLLARQDSLQDNQRRPPTQTLSETLPEPTTELDRSFSRRRKDILQLLNPHGAGVQQSIGFHAICEEEDEKGQHMPSSNTKSLDEEINSTTEAAMTSKTSPDVSSRSDYPRLVEMDSSLSEVSDLDQSIGISNMPAAQYANQSLPFNDSLHIASNAQSDNSLNSVAQAGNGSLSFGLPVLPDGSFEFGFNNSPRSRDSSYNMSRITYYDNSNIGGTFNSEQRLSEMIESSGSDKSSLDSKDADFNALHSEKNEHTERKVVSRSSLTSTNHCLDDLSFASLPIQSPISSPDTSHINVNESLDGKGLYEGSIESHLPQKSSAGSLCSTNVRSQSAWTLAASDNHGFLIPESSNSSEATLPTAKTLEIPQAGDSNLSSYHHAFPGALPWNPSIQSLSDYTKFQRNTDALLNTTISSTIFPANLPITQHEKLMPTKTGPKSVSNSNFMDNDLEISFVEPKFSSSPGSKSSSLICGRETIRSSFSEAGNSDRDIKLPEVLSIDPQNLDTGDSVNKAVKENSNSTSSALLNCIPKESACCSQPESSQNETTEEYPAFNLISNNADTLKTPEIPPQSPERIKMLREIKAARTPNQSLVDVRKASKPTDSSIFDYLHANTPPKRYLSTSQSDTRLPTNTILADLNTTFTLAEPSSFCKTDFNNLSNASADFTEAKSLSSNDSELLETTLRDRKAMKIEDKSDSHSISVNDSPKVTQFAISSETLLSPIRSPNSRKSMNTNGSDNIEWEIVSDESSNSQSEASDIFDLAVDETTSMIDEARFSVKPIVNKDSTNEGPRNNDETFPEQLGSYPMTHLDRNQISNQSLRAHPPFSPTNVPKWSPISLAASSFVSQDFEDEIKSTLESTANVQNAPERKSLIVPRPLPEFKASRSYSLSASGNFEVHAKVFEGTRANTVGISLDNPSKHTSLADSSILRDLSLTNMGLEGYDVPHRLGTLESDDSGHVEIKEDSAEMNFNKASLQSQPSHQNLQIMSDSTKRVILGPRPLPELDISIRQPSFGENISSSMLDLANNLEEQNVTPEFSARGQYVLRESGSYIIATSPQRAKTNNSVAYDICDLKSDNQITPCYNQNSIPRNRKAHDSADELIPETGLVPLVTQMPVTRAEMKGSHESVFLKDATMFTAEMPLSVSESTKAHENWTKLHDISLSDTEETRKSYVIPDKMVLPVKKKSREPLITAKEAQLRKSAEALAAEPSDYKESIHSSGRSRSENDGKMINSITSENLAEPMKQKSDSISDISKHIKMKSKATPASTGTIAAHSSKLPDIAETKLENTVGTLYMNIKSLEVQSSGLPEGVRIKLLIDNGVHSIASRLLSLGELPRFNEGYKVGVVPGCPTVIQLKISQPPSSKQVMEVGSDGSYAQFDLSSFCKTAFGRSCEVAISGRNFWARSNPYVASMTVEVLYLPRISQKERLPKTIGEAVEKISEARRSMAGKQSRASGLLRQFGGDIKFPRGKLRYCVLDPTSPLLIIHSARSKRPRALINLAKAIKVGKIDKNTFELLFKNKDSLAFRTTNSSNVDQWETQLKLAINQKGARPKWLDAVLYET